MRRFRSLLCAAAVSVCATAPAWAAQYFSLTSGVWSNPQIWYPPGGPPGIFDVAIIQGYVSDHRYTVSLDANQTVSQVNIVPWGILNLENYALTANLLQINAQQGAAVLNKMNGNLQLNSLEILGGGEVTIDGLDNISTDIYVAGINSTVHIYKPLSLSSDVSLYSGGVINAYEDLTAKNVIVYGSASGGAFTHYGGTLTADLLQLGGNVSQFPAKFVKSGGALNLMRLTLDGGTQFSLDPADAITDSITIHGTESNLTVNRSLDLVGHIELSGGSQLHGVGDFLAKSYLIEHDSKMTVNGALRLRGGDFLTVDPTSSLVIGAGAAPQLGTVIVAPGGLLGGRGVVSANVIVAGGRVAPGFSPERIFVNGDYTQEAGGALEIEVGGLTPGTEHDQLVVTQTATINGRLEVPLINGFVPQADQEITFITANRVQGAFNAIFSPNLATANPNLALDVIESPTSVRLRFATPAGGIEFEPDSPAAAWSNPSTWSTGVVPGSTHIITVQNLGGAPQRVNVTDPAGSFVHRLLVQGGASTMTVNVQNGASLSAIGGATVADQGAIELTGGTLLSSNVRIQRGGLMSGNGSVIGNVTVGEGEDADLAVLSPGLSVGSISVNGNYRQTSGGELVIEIEGDAPGQFDSVVVSGNATPGGALTVVLADNLDAQPGAVFEAIPAGSLTPDAIFESVHTIGSNDLFVAPLYLFGETAPAPPGAATGPVGVFLGLFREGDMNLDGTRDAADAASFALAISRPDEYFLNYFIDGPESGDIDDDGDIDFDDIDDFVKLMPGLTQTQVFAAIREAARVPEPTGAVLALLAALGFCRRRVRR